MYGLCIQQHNNDIFICSGLVTGMETSTIDYGCIGSPRYYCCKGDCSPNCYQDCTQRGYKKGGVCLNIVTELCCCYEK